MNVYTLCFICTIIPKYVDPVSIEFDGIINLGDEWSYTYGISRLNTTLESLSGTINQQKELKKRGNHRFSTLTYAHKKNKKRLKIQHSNTRMSRYKHSDGEEGRHDISKIGYTRNGFSVNIHKAFKGINNILLNESLVKDNPTIKKFMNFVFNEGLKIFDKIEQQAATSEEHVIKIMVSSLRDTYKRMLGNLINKTLNFKIKTNLDAEKVVKNIMKKSVLYLENELFLLKNGKYKGFINKEIKKLEELEETYACKKMNICPIDQEFSEFLSKILGVIRQFDYEKLKHAVNTATKVLKTTDYSRALDNETQDKFRRFINDFEKMEPFSFSTLLSVLSNVIDNKDYGTNIIVYNGIVVPTINIRELFDIFDKNLAKNDKKNEWEKALQQISGETYNRDIVTKVMTQVVNYFKEVVDKVDIETANKIGFIIKTALQKNEHKSFSIVFDF